MCTSIVEIIGAEGKAKREDSWFALTHAVVAYDHARHAHLDDAVIIDFINHDMGPGARAGVELTLETAKELCAALARAIAAAEIEESERSDRLEKDEKPHTAPPMSLVKSGGGQLDPVPAVASTASAAMLRVAARA